MALLNSFNSGVSAVKTFSKSLEVIGDNIANVNSTGFKGSRVTNQDNFSETLKFSSEGGGAGGGASGTNAMQVGSGTSVASISQQFTQGALTTTGGPADLGISGKGFFKVQNPVTSEFFYTRAGDFRLDETGNLLTNQGFKVMDVSGTQAINIPPSQPAAAGAGAGAAAAAASTANLQSFQIAKDGTISAYYSDGRIFKSTGATPTTNGATNTLSSSAIGLTTFANPNALMRTGDNLLSNGALTTGAPGGPAGATAATTPVQNSTYGNIIQGTLELSNVDLTQQFSDLIVAQRAFQAGSRVITVSDSVMEEIVNLKR
jgi:flagellar hook protein FlgE